MWIVFLLGLLLFSSVFRDTDIIPCMAVIGVTGVVFFAMVYTIINELMKISKRMEKFVRRNNLYKSHSIKEQGILGEWKTERMDYYPIVEYRKSVLNNAFYIRIRMDGSPYAERFRDMEEPLARMFKTVCIDTIVERGYLHIVLNCGNRSRLELNPIKTFRNRGKMRLHFPMKWYGTGRSARIFYW